MADWRLPTTVYELRAAVKKTIGVFLVLCPALYMKALQEPAKEPAVGSISGIVASTEGEHPLKNARVLLRTTEGRFEQQQRATDIEGAFTFTEVRPGRYNLLVMKNGFVPQAYGQKGPAGDGVPLTLAAGQKLKDIGFRLIATSALTGRVVDEDGEPAAGVQVQAIAERNGRGLLARFLQEKDEERWAAAGRAITNDLGEYRIYGLAPGKYFVRAMDTGRLGLTDYNLRAGWWSSGIADQSNKVYPAVYFPGTLRFEQAAAVPLKAAEEIRIDLRLVPLASAVSVAGRIVWPTARPIRTEVWLASRDNENPFAEPRYRATADKSGRFEIKQVVPGSYFLRARAEDGETTYTTRQRLEVADADAHVVLVLGAHRKIVGRLIAGDGAKFDWKATNLYLVPMDGDPVAGAGAEVEKDGTFVIPDVEEGTYRIELSLLRHHGYLKSAHYGMEDILERGLTITKETAVAPLELVVARAGGQLQGTVTNEKMQPVPGAEVLLISERKTLARDRLKVARADQNGRFSMQGIAPGNYKLIASEDDETELASTDLSFAEGESRTVELKAEPQESVAKVP